VGLNLADANARERSQEPAEREAKPEVKPSGKTPGEKTGLAKGEEKAGLPFQITLLETRVRFEANGDSRKEVHTVVKINDAAGARQFARLGFEYNRAFQQVEIPLVKISHENGGTSEVLRSAITDAPNPTVEKFPAYQDVRVKSVRILGLQEGDRLEYRVVTTTTNPPLAPDFWLEHTFEKSGQVLEESYLLEVPGNRETNLRANPKPRISESPSSSAKTYSWHFRKDTLGDATEIRESSENAPDVVLTTFASWEQLSRRLCEAMATAFTPRLWTEAAQRTDAKSEPVPRKTLYDLVSARIATVDLPIDFVKYRPRDVHEILESSYANALDKVRLLDTLLAQERHQNSNVKESIWLVSTMRSPGDELPRPSLFSTILLSVNDGGKTYYLDPSLEVAPFGAIPSKYRGKPALSVGCDEAAGRICWSKITEELPFPSLQAVNVAAKLAVDGTLRAKIKYTMRGDNELMLRMAFHQAPKERWNEVAGLLALSDGFRGHIDSVKASDPIETEKAFEVEYEITQPKFVDWSKKPVRVPALLPQIALPDAPGKAAEKIELGTPLDVETSLTLRLPEGTTVQTPPATSVSRDYATYASKYDGRLDTLTASRQAHFLMREISGDRAADYNAFARAVQLDQTQVLSLFPPEQAEKQK
jgi:hypothetical protein